MLKITFSLVNVVIIDCLSVYVNLYVNDKCNGIKSVDSFVVQEKITSKILTIFTFIENIYNIIINDKHTVLLNV